MDCLFKASERDRWAPFALLIVVNTIFSGYIVLTAAALKGSSLSAIVFSFLRDLIACLILLPACWITEQRRPRADRQFWPREQDWGRIILLGGLGAWGAQLMSSLTIDYLSASIYGLLTPTVPIITAIASYSLGVDVFHISQCASWTKLAGILITVGGAVALVGFSSTISLESANPALGTMYLVFQKLTAGLYPILQKRMLREGYPSLTLAAWAYATGTVLIGMSVLTSAVKSSDWSFSPVSAGAILYSGILSSAFNYACMAYVNGKTSPIVVMAFYPLQSLLTPVLSAAFLNTTLRVSDIITGIVIIVGLATLIYGRSMELRDAVGTAVMSALPTQLNGNTASRPPLKSIAPGKGLSAPIEIEIGAAPSTLKASEATSLLSRA